MASRKTGKAQMKAASTNTGGDAVEAKVVALAEQLGWFLGTVRGKADGWMANPTVHAEVTRIRDGAAELMEQVTRASATAKNAAAGAAGSAIDAAATVTTSARRVAATASTSAKQVAASAGATAKKAVATASTAARKAADKTSRAAKPAAKTAMKSAAKRSGGTVDAPGKRHRKPPPQERVDKRMGEPAGKKMGQKQFQPGHGARRG